MVLLLGPEPPLMRNPRCFPAWAVNPYISPMVFLTHRLFTSEVGTYAGQNVKTADKALCEEIKANGRLVSKDSYTHRYVHG